MLAGWDFRYECRPSVKKGDAVSIEPATVESTVHRVRVRERLRDKLPEILLEAGSVVFALLLAYGVDQWREERGHREMARRAHDTILAELRANRDELRGTHASNRANLEQLQAQITLFRQKNGTSLTTGMGLAQLSGAAFQAAQSTQALQFVDFGWLVRIGRVYELQKTYVVAQESALGEVSASGGAIAGGDDALRVMEHIKSRLATAQQLADGLLHAYDEALAK